MTMNAAPGRAAQSQPEGAQSRLLALAEEEIRRIGFRRMRVVAVAEAAGMTHANVYRYFPSRIALADAVTAAWLKPIETSLSDAATAPDPAIDKLERMILALARSYRDRLEGEPDLFALFCDAMEKARPVTRKHRGRVRQLIERVIDEAMGEGLFEPDARGRALALLFDAMHRFIYPLNVLADRDAPRARWDRRLANVLDAALAAVRGGESRIQA
ncbi:MAG: TetR family transcriptional regulator [Beijerinckiaceae bacterium]